MLDIYPNKPQCWESMTAGDYAMHEAYDAIDLGRSIRLLREQRGWTQMELAAWLGVHRTTVIALEKGGTVSMPVAMKAIALLGAKAVLVPKAPTSAKPDIDSNA